MSNYNFKIDEKFKQNSILELEKELRTRGENNLPSNWENYLTLDYWKNWREKIKSFHYMDEVHLYERIFKEIRTWIADVCANPHKYNSNVIKEVEQELSRIPIITNNVGGDRWTFLPQDPQELIMIRNKRSTLHGFIHYESWNIPNWENYLTLDYWKNYQKKIMDFKNIKELHLYGDRLSALRNFIENKVKGCSYANWNQERNISNITIAEEEARLAEIESEEDWKKDVANAFPNTILKELSFEEMKNDPWFREQLGLGSEKEPTSPRNCAFCFKIIDPFQYIWANNEYFCNKECMSNQKPKKDTQSKDDQGFRKNEQNEVDSALNSNNKKQSDYKTWTKDQLIAEINLLKAENEELKNNQILTSSEKENRLQQNQEKLERLNSYYNATSQPSSQPNNSNFPTGWIVGGGILLAIGGIIALGYKKKLKKKQ